MAENQNNCWIEVTATVHDARGATKVNHYRACRQEDLPAAADQASEALRRELVAVAAAKAKPELPQ